MKKFINEHPRLYWIIVILIAGLVFGIVTGIGCAKLEKAEASVSNLDALINYAYSLNRSVDNIVILQDSEGNYYTMVEDLRDDEVYLNGNFIVTSYNSCSPILVTPGWWTHKWYRITADRTSEEVNFSHNVCTGTHFTELGLQFVYSTKPVLAMGGTDTDGDGIYFQNVVVRNPVYFANAPFLEFQSVETQSNYANDEINPIDEGYHIVNYKIAGQPMTPPDGYKVLYEYRVYLPTKDYFRQFFREDMLPTLESLDSMKSNIPKWRRNSVGSSDSKLWIFNLDRNIDADKTNGDDVRIRLDYADIQTEIEEFNSVSLKEYYGFNDDEWSAYGKYIMAHLVVYRVDCIVYTYNTPDIYYGRNITVHFPPYLDKPIVTEYNGDYFNPDYDYDKQIDAEIDQALKDAKAEADKLISEYETAIKNQENALGSFDTEFGDAGLWEAVKGVGTGLIGSMAFINKFAVFIGGVFGFLPYDIRQYAGYVIIVILLLGIWKMLKR